jgi:hypothetical protein
MLPILANLFNLAFGSRHQMGQIFIWGILQICVLYFPAVLLMVVWHFSLREYAYAAWLSTFDEDWIEKNEYALWWKLIGFGLWLSNLKGTVKSAGKKFESLLNGIGNSIKLRMSDLVPTWKQERIELELAEQAKKKKMMEDIEFDDIVVSKLLK